LAAIDPLDIIPYLYYPYILGAVAIGHIIGMKEVRESQSLTSN